MAITKNGNAIVAGAPDTSTWIQEKTGFDPYWKPEEGKHFIARVVGRDERDPEFIRYTMKAEQDGIACQTGPTGDATQVIVNRGETFNVSQYAQLDNLFNEYMESGIFPAVQVRAIKEVSTSKKGQTVWTYDVRISPDDKKALVTFRAEKAIAMGQARTKAELRA